MSMGLAQRLREGTSVLHGATERAGLMPALLRGTLSAAVFHRLQRNLQAIYDALETGLAQHAAHPLLAPLLHPALPRRAALAADLAALHGPDWAGALALAPAAQAYVARLQRLAQEAPQLLAAHVYVRYLGDLSGGQALRKVVQRCYAPAGGGGVQFYDFGPPAQVAALALGLRQALDGLPVDADTAAALLAEAQWSFAQHAQLFTELDAAPALPS